MNDAELDAKDGAKTFAKEPNRVTRCAQGAGVMEREVNEVLKQYKIFAQVIFQSNHINIPDISNCLGFFWYLVINPKNFRVQYVRFLYVFIIFFRASKNWLVPKDCLKEEICLRIPNKWRNSTKKWPK